MVEERLKADIRIAYEGLFQHYTLPDLTPNYSNSVGMCYHTSDSHKYLDMQPRLQINKQEYRHISKAKETGNTKLLRAKYVTLTKDTVFCKMTVGKM